MKRLLQATSIAFIACLLGLVGVMVALGLTLIALRAIATTEPTTSNRAKFTSNGHTYYGPDTLVVLRGILIPLLIVLVVALPLSLFARPLLAVVERRKRRPELLQSQQLLPSPSDFLIDVGTISWIIPKSVTWAVIRSRRVLLTFVIGLMFLWSFVDLLYRFYPKPNSPPEWMATECAVGIVPLVLLIAFFILNLFSIVTLNHKGIRVEWTGKPGRRSRGQLGGRRSTVAYQSIIGCSIEPSRLVPGLLGLTFTMQSEKTVWLELPLSADVGAIVQFLSAKGVVCVDWRCSEIVQAFARYSDSAS
jgi:hypothetical protein